MGNMTQAQTSERERLVVALRTTNFVSISDQYAAADMLRADAEKIRALEADAARYRWLRNRADPDNDEPYITRHVTNDWGKWFNTWEHADAADACIDAALAATQSPRSEAGEDK